MKYKCIKQSVWITTAWQHTSPEETVKSFKKCSISNVVDGTEDKLWNGNKKDGNVRSECEEDEGTDCEDGGSDTDW
jgi:hypothetical protein